MGLDISQYRVPTGIDPQKFSNVVSAAYTAYVGARGTIPTVNEIAEYCRHSKKTIAKIVDTPEFKFAIKARGVNWENESGLTTKQMLALTVVTNPSDRRDLRQKLRSIGATHVEYQAWLREPLFRRKIDELSERMLGDNMANVHQALVNKASGGDTRAIQLYYELTGRHDPAARQVIEMQNIIRLLLEVITRNVTDAGMLERITQEIDTQVMPKMITGQVVQ
jgi:hypothetical protein